MPGTWFNSGDFTAFDIWNLKYIMANIEGAVNELDNLCGRWLDLRWVPEVPDLTYWSSYPPVSAAWQEGDLYPVEVDPESYVGYCYEHWGNPTIWPWVNRMRSRISSVCSTGGVAARPCAGSGVDTTFTDLQNVGPGVDYFLTKAGWTEGWISLDNHDGVKSIRDSRIFTQLRDVILAMDRWCWRLDPCRPEMPANSLPSIYCGRRGYVGTYEVGDNQYGWDVLSQPLSSRNRLETVGDCWTITKANWNDAEAVSGGEDALTDAAQLMTSVQWGRQFLCSAGGRGGRPLIGVGLDIYSPANTSVLGRAQTGLVRRVDWVVPTDLIIGAHLYTQVSFSNFSRGVVHPDGAERYLPYVARMVVGGHGTYTPPYSAGVYDPETVSGLEYMAQNLEAPSDMLTLNTDEKQTILVYLDNEPSSVPNPAGYNLWGTGAYATLIGSQCTINFPDFYIPPERSIPCLKNDGVGTWVWTNIANHRYWR